MQNAFSTVKLLKRNLPNMFHFTKLEKLWIFFLKPYLIPTLDLLKRNVLLSTMVTVMVIMIIMGKG